MSFRFSELFIAVFIKDRIFFKAFNQTKVLFFLTNWNL